MPHQPTASTSKAISTTPLPQNAPHLLLCEALGFSPQLLLDDIINIANNAVQDGVNGMEEFLEKWADERISSNPPPTNARSDAKAKANLEATTHEVEQGLVAFQTLLEYHTDIAFDFFEAWSLRNIFMISSDLPIVLPHMEGLDLTITSEQEQEAVEEVEELRRILDVQHRKLNRVLTRAIRTSTRQQRAAESRLAQLSSLLPPSPTSSQSASLQTLTALPPKLLSLHQTLISLPPISTLPAPHTTGSSSHPAIGLVEPGKRVWETSQTGYVNWALGRLLYRSQAQASGSGAGSSPTGSSGGEDSGKGQGIVDRIDRSAAEIGSGEELRSALEVIEGVRRELNDALSRSRDQGRGEGADGDSSFMDEDSRMEE
ncbi:Mis12 protein-domain-containing protein [Gymnopilus junonius]|uniref:Mis12 protein-domain-containing protein n=1 Tax=Gymnopilus junonius TaxID=109634 RepID=A0A9P5THD1_GYMJU|nr:Mis12 protein-domain-containing protein [Gymnopilus junonius]